MNDQLRDGHIVVEDLGDPSPLPPEFSDELERDELERDEAAPPPPMTDPLEPERIGFLRGFIPAIFRLVGMGAGWRVRAAGQAAIRAVWSIDPSETAELAIALAPLVPERVLASRAMRSAGIAGGLLMLAGAIANRATATVQLRHEYEVHHADDSPAGAEPAADAGARRAGPRPGSDRGPVPGEPVADGAVPPVDGFTGAGLGLGEDR